MTHPLFIPLSLCCVSCRCVHVFLDLHLSSVFVPTPQSSVPDGKFNLVFTDIKVTHND